MKRFHVHVAVDDLQKNIRFYSTVFGAQPEVVKDDYAKWMLEDPRINFAISTHGKQTGINHLGLQVDSEEELEALHGHLAAADAPVAEQKGVACCYAKSDKYWVTDPQGIAWEAYRTLGSVEMFGGDAAPSPVSGGTEQKVAACCGPTGCGPAGCA